MKKISSVCGISLLALALLAGCTSAQKKDTGMIAGGVVGGVAGSALTGGSTAGAIVGAVGGGYVGRQLSN